MNSAQLIESKIKPIFEPKKGTFFCANSTFREYNLPSFNQMNIDSKFK